MGLVVVGHAMAPRKALLGLANLRVAEVSSAHKEGADVSKKDSRPCIATCQTKKNSGHDLSVESLRPCFLK